jgi:DNA-binding NarL/FixJ family response regulator
MEFKAQIPTLNNVGRQAMEELLAGQRLLMAFGNHLTLIAMSYLPAFNPVLVGGFTTEQEAINALNDRKPTIVMASEELEVGYGISLVSKVKDISPDTSCLLFLTRNNPEVIEEAIGAGADSVVRIQSMSDGTGDFIQAVTALGKGRTYFPADVREVIKQDTKGIEKLQMLNELTAKEVEVLTLLCRGLSNNEIAQTMVTSVPTTKTHVSNLMSKLNQPSRTALVVLAVRHSLVDFE